MMHNQNGVESKNGKNLSSCGFGRFLRVRRAAGQPGTQGKARHRGRKRQAVGRVDGFLRGSGEGRALGDADFHGEENLPGRILCAGEDEAVRREVEGSDGDFRELLAGRAAAFNRRGFHRPDGDGAAFRRPEGDREKAQKGSS